MTILFKISYIAKISFPKITKVTYNNIQKCGDVDRIKQCLTKSANGPPTELKADQISYQDNPTELWKKISRNTRKWIHLLL